MASITDVAKQAGVGVGTVSRVLSGNGYVSDKTKAKVMKAIKELHYVPNELARNLIQKKSNTIAVIVPDISNYFFSSLINEFEQKLRILGYKTLLCNSYGEKTNEKSYLELLDRNLVDGIITASSLLSNASYAEIKKPIVSLDSILSDDIPMVCADHRNGGRIAAEMLIQAGCKHVIQFRDSIDSQIKSRGANTSVTVEYFPYALRHTEFQKVIEDAGIRYDEILTNGAVSLNEQRICAEQGFKLFSDIDGVFATDIMALQYAHVAMLNGKRIPEDLKIIAYDGTDIIKLFYPDVSAIVQPIADIADIAVKLLMKQINGEVIEKKQWILPVSVINRNIPPLN